ncbi:MAG: hypothetical protein M4579_005235 [Chaenotheca gracillima]|nr:MAG: hypothetical protein M4579_005235 [Chaenotheca gracillima]
MQRKRVAVVGSGCSGLGALWALKSTGHEVHLFEGKDRLGGHTNTVTFRHGQKETAVDTGFIVLNTATYPNLIAFLKEINIPIKRTEMTFGVSRDKGLFEWAGTSLDSIFAQRSNILRPSYWRMIFEIIRFNQYALDLLRREADSEEVQRYPYQVKITKSMSQESLGDYLDREGYSAGFRDNYLIPMTASVWSTTPDKCSLEFPVLTLVRFLWNHHLLSSISARPDWLTIPGGSKQYIEAVLKDVPNDRIHTGDPVASVRNVSEGKVALDTKSGKQDVFDHVIIAAHGDQILDMLQADVTEQERDILSGFKTSKNVAYMHSDLDLMPKRRVAWSSWNYMTRSSSKSSNVNQVCLTYWMNLLQHIPEKEFGHVLVTLNPLSEPRPELTQGRWEYHHPLYNAAAIRSQSLLPEIQNTRGISYAGAWTKYGFHEDGFSSGLKVAIDHLGAKLPFEFRDSTFSRGRRPELTWQDYVVRAGVTMLLWVFWIVGGLLGIVGIGHDSSKRAKIS